MIIDGRTLNLNSNPFAPKAAFIARSAKEAEALKQLMTKSGRNDKILIDFEPLDATSNFDGFQTDFGTVNNPKAITGNIPMAKFYMSFELDYSAEDALRNNWAASTRNTRGTVFSGGETVKSEEVIGMNQEQFLSYVRENGLDKDINWNTVYTNMRGSSSYEDFTEYTDYVASLYASLHERITNDFEGDEQVEQLNTLNQIFDDAINTTSKFYISEINETYKQFGIDVPEGELTQSIREVMTTKKDVYLDYIESNKDYANLVNSEDKWLERDVAYMANALRKTFKPEEVNTKSGFSENDIKAVGMIASMYSGSALDVKAGFGINTEYKDEESVGLALSMKYLTQATAIDTFVASDDVKNLASGLFDKYKKIVIESVNKTLSSQQKNMPIDSDGKYTAEMFPQLNKDDIYAVLNVMIKTYEETKDAEKSIYETTSFAYNQFKNNESKVENASVFRYSGDYDTTGKRYFVSSKNFWNDFYDNGKTSSYMGKLINKWNGYASALENNDLKALFAPDFNSYRSWTLFDTPLIGGYSAATGWWGDKI